MNIDDIKRVWLRNGGNAAAVDVAAAVAMAESGGDPAAHNDNPGTGDDSWGLWQINYYGALKIPRTLSFGPSSTMTDPDRNAAAAIALSSNGTYWRPWTTYTSGRYRQFLTASSPSLFEPQPAQQSGSFAGPWAMATSTGTAPSSSTAGTLRPGHSGLTLWGMATNQEQMAQAFVRLGEIVVGGLLMGGGLYLVGYALVGRTTSSAVKGPVGAAAKKFTPAGRALSMVKKTETGNRQKAADLRASSLEHREKRHIERVTADESRSFDRKTSSSSPGVNHRRRSSPSTASRPRRVTSNAAGF